MRTKVIPFTAAVVALGGFASAVAIPTASAARPHATYCENTSTTYGSYGENCPTTTSTTPSTTTTAPTTTTTATSPSATPDFSTLTQGQAYAYLNALPNVTVSKLGTVTITSLTANLPAGLALAPNVSVVSNTASGVVLDIDGTDYTIPYGAPVTVYTSGLVVYYLNGVEKSLRVGAAAALKAQTSVTQYVLAPKTLAATKLSYVLPAGVSFGKTTTNAKIASYFTVKTVKTPSVKVGVKAAANKGRTAFTLKFAKPERAVAIVFSLKGLEYTKAAEAKIKAGKTTRLTSKFNVYTLAGAKSVKNVTSLAYKP